MHKGQHLPSYYIEEWGKGGTVQGPEKTLSIQEACIGLANQMTSELGVISECHELWPQNKARFKKNQNHVEDFKKLFSIKTTWIFHNKALA